MTRRSRHLMTRRLEKIGERNRPGDRNMACGRRARQFCHDEGKRLGKPTWYPGGVRIKRDKPNAVDQPPDIRLYGAALDNDATVGECWRLRRRRSVWRGGVRDERERALGERANMMAMRNHRFLTTAWSAGLLSESRRGGRTSSPGNHGEGRVLRLCPSTLPQVVSVNAPQQGLPPDISTIGSPGRHASVSRSDAIRL